MLLSKNTIQPALQSEPPLQLVPLALGQTTARTLRRIASLRAIWIEATNSLVMPDRRPPLTTLVNEGKAIAANTPITAITIIFSASEKPRTPAHGGEQAIGTAREKRCGMRSPARFWVLSVSRTTAQLPSLSDRTEDRSVGEERG